MSTWWKHYGKGRKLTILLIEDKDKIIAIAPLMHSEYSTKFGIKLRKIEFIGTSHSDYHNFILTVKETECLKLFMNYLYDYPDRWDCLELREIPETFRSIDLLRRMSQGSNTLKERVSSICPYILLPNSYEVFFGKLGRNMRRNLRRWSRKLREEYEVKFDKIDNIDSIQKAIKTFYELHRKRWRSKGLPGLFADKIFRDFHLDIAKCFAGRGWLNLSFLTVNDKPISSSYGFEYNQKFYYYLSGFDSEYSKYGVGNILNMHLIDNCIRREMKEFDFLRGADPYKSSWNTLNRRNIELSIRKGLLANLYGWIKESDSCFARKLKNTLPKSRREKEGEFR